MRFGKSAINVGGHVMRRVRKGLDVLRHTLGNSRINSGAACLPDVDRLVVASQD
jgi:hypothetical protein